MISSNGNKISIVFGGTGGVGYFITKYLLERNFKVRLVVRNIEKTKKVFKEDYEKFEKVFVIDYLQETENYIKNGPKGIFKEVFQINKEDKIEFVFQATGNRKFFNERMTKKIDYILNKILIDKSKELNVNKFIFISAACITKRLHIVSILLNFFLGTVMGWKLMAENYLRESGLNYVIIRPGQLVDRKNPSPMIIRQGDNITNKSDRASVGKLAVECLFKSNFPKKYTIECEIIKNSENKDFDIEIKGNDILKEDDKNSICKVNHFHINSIVKTILISTFILSLSLLVKNLIYKKH